jgi:hypothetical protein
VDHNDWENAVDILEKLVSDGWALSVEVINSGGYKVAAEYTVTVSRNGREFSTSYTSGWGNRVWTGFKGLYCWNPGKKGTSANVTTKYKLPEDCEPSARPRQTEVMAEFARLTEPVRPTLPDVLYALVMDAGCVCNGDTFEEFCADLGYDADSRTAERVFNGCRDSWTGLVRMGADIADLHEILLDY